MVLLGLGIGSIVHRALFYPDWWDGFVIDILGLDAGWMGFQLALRCFRHRARISETDVGIEKNTPSRVDVLYCLFLH